MAKSNKSNKSNKSDKKSERNIKDLPIFMDMNSGRVMTKDGKRCIVLLADNFIEIGETLFSLFGDGAQKILIEMGRRGVKPYVDYWSEIFKEYNISDEVTTLQLLCMVPRLSGYGQFDVAEMNYEKREIKIKAEDLPVCYKCTECPLCFYIRGFIKGIVEEMFDIKPNEEVIVKSSKLPSKESMDGESIELFVFVRPMM